MPPSADTGGAGLGAITGSENGSEEVPGSIGPGPCTTRGPNDAGASRWMGTRSCLDNAFSAGESTSALPVALRINVYSDKEKNEIDVVNGAKLGYRTSGFL
jgi:hypothetical protein